MIKDIGVWDLALIELASGRKTEAPPEILQKLAPRGFLTLSAGRPSLTKTGRARGLALAGYERQFRAEASGALTGNGSRMGLTTGRSGGGFHFGGGSAKIRS